MAKNNWRSVTEPMTDNSEKNTWNSAKTPISSAKNVTENNYAIENWYRAEQSGDPNAGDALLGASLSQKDFDNWEQWHKQNAGKLDVEYTFKSLDQDVLSRVADKYKSQWGDKQYYDMFDPDDAYRQQTGAMPKYLINKYDLNDPYDRYLYENNLPYRTMFNDMYSEAYKDYTAEKEEEAAYNQQYMNFQFDLYSQMLEWQQNEETAAVQEGRDPQDVDPESFIANLLVDPKYADVAKHFQLPGEDEEEPDAGTYDFLNDYLKANKKEPDERAFTVDDLMNPYYEMLDQARAEQEAKWWASLTDAEQRQVSIYRSEQNIESLNSEIDALNKDIARAQNRGEDASALISQRDEKKSQKKKLETDIAAARKEDRSKSYEEYDQALLSMDINSDTREADLKEQLDDLKAKRDEAWEAENKARVGGRWEEYMQLAATREGLDKEITALSAQLNGATLEKSMATAMQNLEKYKQLAENPDFAANSVAPVNGDGKQDVYKDWDAQTRTDYLVLNDHPDGILSTDGNANKYRWISKYATDEEIATLNYIANTQGEAATREYMDALGDVLKIRNIRDESDAVEDFTSTTGGAIVGSVATVPMSIASAVEGAGNMLGAANGDGAIDMMYNASATRFRTGVRSNVSERILANNSESFIPGISAGQIWNFLYQTGMSMADTAARLPLGYAGLAVAGLDAASSTMIDQLESGATTNQALGMAAIAGVAETLTEKIGLDNLFKPDKWMAGTFKQFILNTLKQGGAEASEEILSEIINIIGEEMIRADESELRQQVADYMKEKGCSEGAAYAAVLLSRIGEAGLGGFVSGLFFGAGGQVVTIANTDGGMKTLEAYNEAKRQGKALSTDLNIAFTRDIMTLGLSDEATTQALSVKDAYANQPASLITPEGHALLQNMVNVVNEAARTQNTQNNQRLARQIQARSRLNSLYHQATELRNEAAAALERGDIASHTKLIQKCNDLIKRYTAAYEAESATLDAENAKAEEQHAKTERKVLDAVEKAANQIPVEVENQRTKLAETVAVQADAQQDAEIIAGMTAQTGTQYQAGVTRMDSGKKLSRNARQQLRVLDGLGKKYNTPIVVEDTITRTGKDGMVYSGMDNAYYDPKDGSIHVALDAEEGAYMFFAVHELVHKIETESSEMYTILHDFVIDKLNANNLYAQLSKGEGNTFDGRVASVMELYAKNGVELTRKQAESEIIADAIPVILTDKQTVQELVRTDRTLAERIRDFFEEFFDELTHMVAQLAFGDANKAEVAYLMADQETVREIADLFTAALESTNKSGLFYETAKNGEYSANYDGNQTESGESKEGNGDIRHSIAQIVAGDGSDYGIGVVLDSNMLTGLSKYERREMVKLRVLDELAGKTVIAYDGENNPVEISFAQKNEKFLNSAGKKRRVLDEISRKSIDKEIKQEAVVIADELISASKSGSSSPSYHSHGWLDDWGKNNWDTRTVYIQEKNKTVWEATLHIANPADGRKILYDIDPIKMVAGSVKTVPTTTNTNITDVGTKSNTSDENSDENFYNDLVNSGDQPRLSVKSSGRDSEGNTLSEGQAEYFKDSKMRDDDGNLLVVYHGSPAYDEITTFKRGKKGWLGSGIYVTSRKSDAQRYADKMGPGGRIYSLYANVTNPLVVTEKNPVPVILKAAYGRDSVYRNRSAKQANDPDIITRSDIQKLAGAGYDGIIWKYGGSVEASVFDPEQVKRTDNTKPTSNPDTRFSMKSTGEANLFDSMMGNDQQTEERLAVSEKELARVKAENERLSERIDALKEQFKVTKGYRPNEKALRRVAQGVLKRASSKYDADTLTEDLRGLFDSIGNQDGFDGDSIMATANAIARKVLEKSSERDDTVYEATKDARDYFRRARLSLTDKQKAETASAYDSYNAYRRSLMGKLNLANDGLPLDQAWGEISEMFPGYFDKNTPEGDQPAKVKEFLETAYARPYRNPYGTLYDMDDAAYELASELFDEYFNVPQVQTFADKQRSKLNEANRKYRESIEAERRAYEEQYQDALALSRGMREIELKNLAKKYSEAMDDQKAEYRQKYREMVRKKNRQLDEQNAAFQAQKKRRAETRENAKYRDRIRKNAKELYTWLQTPNKKKHVPAALQNTVAKLLENIDIEGQRPSQKADAWRDAVRGLSDMYSKYALGKGELAESGVYFSVPDAMLDALDMLTSSAENGRKLGDLNTEELRSLDLVVAVTKSAVTNVNKLYANKRYGDVATVADRTINEVSGQKQRNYQSVGKLLNVDMLDSFSYARMLGDGAESIIGALEKGAEKSYDKIRQGSNFVEKTLSDVGVKDRDLNKWSKDKVSFKLESGKEVKLTQAKVMALYALNKRAQARQHILSGGIEIAERGRDQKQLDTFKVTEDDISNILGSLTDEQKRIMDALQGFLSNDAAAWGNEVWMELYQYEMFGEKNYWPIRSAASGTKTEDPDAVRAINAMLNIGATKSLNANANNPIVIEDAFDVFSKHIAQMARLNGLAAPLEDALKWYNYVALDENGARDYDRVTKKAIERVFGKSGNQYFLQLIKDINGLSQGGTGTEIPSKLLSNYKRAAVAGKLRVVVQQPTAIIRATALVNPKFFATKSAAQVRENIREMQEKNPLAWWKSQGNYEIGTGRSMRGMLFGSENALDAVTNLAMEPAGLADNLAWGVLWAAVKNEVKTYNKGIDTDSDAYWEKVTDRFNEVVNQTQVVDSVMHRSQIMRSKSDLAQMSTSFMSEPTKTYNMVRNCIMDVKLGRSGSKKKLVRALIALIMSIAANAAVKGLHDTLRDRDEDDEFGEMFADKFVSGFLDDVNPLGYIPYVKDALSIVQGYDVERLDTAALSDAWTSIKHAYEAIVTGDSRYTDYKLVTDVAKSVSSLTGLPLPGLIDLVNMTANTISPGAIPKYHSLDKEQRQEAKAAGLDVGELERVMSGYERGTNADKALSLLAMSEKTGADYSEEEFDLIAEIVGLNYSSSKNGPLDKWAEKEQKRYLKGKQSELKDGEITQEEYDEIEDRFDEYWRIIVGG